MYEQETVEEVVDSATTEPVEEVADSTTAFDFSDTDILGIETSEQDEVEEPQEELETDELLTGEVQEESNVQKRINEITRQKKEAQARLAHAENLNKYLMAQQEKYKIAEQRPAMPELKEPVYKDYLEKNDHDDALAMQEFITAKTDYEVRKRMQSIESEKLQNQRAAQIQKAEVDFTNNSWSEENTKKYPDFHTVVFNPLVQFTGPVKELIYSSPKGHDIAYTLAHNIELRDQINKMSPAAAGKAIGILEARWMTPLERKTKSKAPQPISPVGSKANAKSVKYEDLPTDEFIKAEQKKMAASGGW